MRKVVFLLFLSGLMFAWAYSNEKLQAFGEKLLKPMQVVEEKIVLEDADQTPSAPKGDAENAEADAAQEAPTRWVVGIEVAPVLEAIRAQIPKTTLGENQGVLAMRIFPNSPADKAGLKNFDILLKLNGVELKQGEEVVKIVRECEGKTLQFEILRAGAKETIEVTPEKQEIPLVPMVPNQGKQNFRLIPAPGTIPMQVPERWQENGGIPPFDIELPEGLPQEITDMIKELRDGNGGIRIQIAPNNGAPNIEVPNIEVPNIQIPLAPNGPGMQRHTSRTMVVIRDGKQLSITVEERNNEPAQLRVEWDGEVFETNSGDLDILPEEIRGQVEDFLNQKPFKVRTQTAPLPEPDDEASDQDADAEVEDEGTNESEDDEVRIDPKKTTDLTK
ncbi:MAG: PDZ domain-containing protein [Planctomycetia bacterium]|nr:PDZ domain-containing protein [Planctomycetia bacterium]